MVAFNQTTANRRRAVSIRSMATLFAASAGAVLLAATPLRSLAAQADESSGDNPPSVTVSYADLNLASDVDARVLLERIRHAAEQVCPAADRSDLQYLHRLEERGRCIREAIARAVQQVGNPRLAAVYSAHANQG